MNMFITEGGTVVLDVQQHPTGGGFQEQVEGGLGSSHFAVENILTRVKREGGMYVLLLLIIIQIIFL